MKLSIYKYNLPVNEWRGNYFDNQITINDRIDFFRLPLNALPVFKEESTDQDDVNILKTGYFDVRLQLTMTERSTLGKSLSEFFENFGAGNKLYKYLVVFEMQTIERSVCGVADMDTLRADRSPGVMSLSFSVTGIEAEVVAHMRGSATPRPQSNMNFEKAYLNYLLSQVTSNKLRVKSLLDLESKAEAPLIVQQISHNNFLDANPGYLIWSAVKSFMVSYGFRFKVFYTGVARDYPEFAIEFYYRSEGNRDITIPRWIKMVESLADKGSKYVAVFYTGYTDAIDPNVQHYTGFIAGRTYIYYSSGADYLNYNSQTGMYYNNNFSLQTHESEVKVMNVERLRSQPGGTFVNYIALSRCVNNDAWDGLRRWYANVETGHLLKATKKMRTVTFKAPESLAVTLGSRCEFDSVQYTAERINQYNPHTHTMEAEWIES